MATQNTSQVDTNATPKAGLVTDLNSSYVGKDVYSHARNATRASKEGDLGTIGNEPSTLSCIKAPYKIIGHVDLPDDTVLIFSTDNVNSEIGIGNPTDCSYTRVNNLSCLNFNDKFPITGVAKKDFGKGTIVTFTDKNNPVRRIELKTFADVANCDEFLLFKKIGQPCITAERGQVGNIPNGMFSVALAYVVDNQIFSDYYSITTRIPLFSENGSNSIEVKISGLDQEFDQFTLVVVGTYIEPNTKAVTKLAKRVGNFSTKVRSLSITDFINPTLLEVQLANLVIQKRTWLKAGIISSNTNYLLLGDLVARQEEDYQLKAFQIETEYVVEQVPANYYEFDGRDVSYYRDENYDWYIQGVYTTGEMTDKYHIAGRIAESSELSPVSSSDVYELDTQFQDCEPIAKIPRWRVENTAERMIPEANEFSCGRRIIGTGKMGYHESTDLYPDNPAMFGEWANTPIRFHRMPDECKVPRYSTIDGVTYINILGVRFKNIPHFDNPDIIGYKITRSDRKGGNGTIVARGLATNIRSYVDNVVNQTIYYSNYPVNDLAPDQYLSSTQTVFKNNKETNFTPLIDFHLDKFSFYSPHTLFEPRYSLGPEIKIECQEIADITGKFEIVYNHPQQKLMNQFSFWLSAAIGFIESSLVILGKQRSVATSTNKNTSLVTSGTIAPTIKSIPIGNTDHSFSKEYNINSVEDLVSLDIVGFIRDKILARDLSAITIVRRVLTLLASLAIKVPMSIFSGIRQADETLEIIRNFTGYTDYVYQYNSHALFNRSVCVPAGNKRRRLLRPALYIPPTTVSVNGDKIFNNLFRERTVFLELNKAIPKNTVTDNSRGTVSSFGRCDDPTAQVKSVGAAYYATSKVINPNQYGQLGSSSPVAIHSCVISFEEENPILYGGDCVITRFQFQKRMQFFSQNLANTNFPPGVEYDYRKYRNIGYPRFWIDSTKYDFSELLSGNVINFARFSRTTTSKHNLDCKSGDKKSIARIDDAYMYLFNNCALDFFVEADYNTDYREKTTYPFFAKDSQDISQIFRSDRLAFPEEFVISRAYADLYTTEIFAPMQRDDFDPTDPIPVSQPNSVVYSLPSFNMQEVDNWQYFLPANIFAFRESEHGKMTAIHKVDQDRLIFLFSKSSPYISMGKDFLALEGSGRKITIGDGGLFAQDPREIMPTDNNYGACNSRYAFSNTHLGRFYPSEKQGRILNFAGEGLDDIARQGISYWCKNYMPIALYNYFPTYLEDENPVAGVGYLMAFDSFNETVYITKRDFSPRRELINDITYDTKNKQFLYKGNPIILRDSRFFNDISWTLSYCPVDKAFVSWHDWHPDWVIQRDNHFLSVKGDTIYKHNERYDSFCNFYGEDFPFEVEFVSTSGQQVEIVRSLEYFLEVYHYKNFGRDRFHVHHENFSNLIVSNSEQISPLLNLVYRSNNPEQDIQYPRKNSSNVVSWDILYSKEENKYRVNQFWDATKDRGEFSTSEFHLFPTDESGYKQVINPLGIDVDKPEEQRKKFRHYFNKFRFMKSISGPNKFITKIYNIKKMLSMR